VGDGPGRGERQGALNRRALDPASALSHPAVSGLPRIELLDRHIVSTSVQLRNVDRTVALSQRGLSRRYRNTGP
jgi:hypothetical protein